MYKILGTDLKEYGPVNLEKVIQWINEGRADAQTRALPEGSTEWKPLSSLPEFAAALAAKAVPAPPIAPAMGEPVAPIGPASTSTPIGAITGPEASVPGGTPVPGEVPISPVTPVPGAAPVSADAPSSGEPPSSGTPPPPPGATPPPGGVPPFGPTPPPISPPPPPFGSNPHDSQAMAERVLARGGTIDPTSCISRSWDLLMRHFWVLFGATLVVNLLDNAVPILHGPLYGGLYLLFLRHIRRQKSEFADVFAGFSEYFLQLFLVGLVAGLLTLLAYGFCILPGIYFTIAWLFAIPLVIDKRLEFWPAMEVSLRVVHRNWIQFFVLGLLILLVGLVGLLAFCIGIYVALPVIIGAIAYAYEDVFGSEPPAPPRPL